MTLQIFPPQINFIRYYDRKTNDKPRKFTNTFHIGCHPLKFPFYEGYKKYGKLPQNQREFAQQILQSNTFFGMSQLLFWCPPTSFRPLPRLLQSYITLPHSPWFYSLFSFCKNDRVRVNSKEISLKIALSGKDVRRPHSNTSTTHYCCCCLAGSGGHCYFWFPWFLLVCIGGVV